MNQPPLNPDGVLNAMDTLMAETDADARATEWARKVTTRVLEGYFAAALPEVTSVESIPAKMRMLMWEGGEVEVGEIPDGYVLVGFEMETDRAWSMADKVTINIERREVNDA